MSLQLLVIQITNYSTTSLDLLYDGRESSRTELMTKSKSAAEMDFYDYHHQRISNNHSQYTYSSNKPNIENPSARKLLTQGWITHEG